MRHKLYGSIAEMLSPQTLSELLGSPVTYVRCLPMAGGLSGGRLMLVELDRKPSARLVLKHMSPAWDWGCAPATTVFAAPSPSGSTACSTGCCLCGPRHHRLRL